MKQPYVNNFRKGRCYLRFDGVPVRIIAESDKYGPHYRCVQGDDGFVGWMEDFQKSPITGKYGVVTVWSDGTQSGFRYDRASDPGRCTGSHFLYDPRNLVVGSDKTLRAAFYRLECSVKDFFAAVLESINNQPYAYLAYWH